MRAGLFNIVNQEMLSDTVKHVVNTCSATDILVPTICIGLENGEALEDYTQISPMVVVGDYRSRLADRPFVMHYSNESDDEDILRKLEYLYSALESKYESFGHVTPRELAFYDAMVSYVSNSQTVALESLEYDPTSLTFSNENKVAKLADGITMITRLVFSAALKALSLVLSAFSTIAKIAEKIDSVVKWFIEVIEDKPIMVPRSLRRRIMAINRREALKLRSSLSTLVQDISSLDITDRLNWDKFKRRADEVLPDLKPEVNLSKYAEKMILGDIDYGDLDGEEKRSLKDVKKEISKLRKDDLSDFEKMQGTTFKAIRSLKAQREKLEKGGKQPTAEIKDRAKELKLILNAIMAIVSEVLTQRKQLLEVLNTVRKNSKVSRNTPDDVSPDESEPED